MADEHQFWTDYGDTFTWTWTLPVLVLIFLYRSFSSRFRATRFSSSSSSSTSKARPRMTLQSPPLTPLPLLQNDALVTDSDLMYLLESFDEKSPSNAGVVWENAFGFEVFPFLTPREYVLAWRIWQGVDGSYYCFNKFRTFSMVHQEDAGLNVDMAQIAFAKGIWSYVCKMNDALRRYSSGMQHQLNSTASALTFIQKKVKSGRQSIATRNRNFSGKLNANMKRKLMRARRKQRSRI